MYKESAESAKSHHVIGLLGRKEFMETWQCIKARKQEPPKCFENFERRKLYEDTAAKFF